MQNATNRSGQQRLGLSIQLGSAFAVGALLTHANVAEPLAIASVIPGCTALRNSTCLCDCTFSAHLLQPCRSAVTRARRAAARRPSAP